MFICEIYTTLHLSQKSKIESGVEETFLPQHLPPPPSHQGV